MKKGILEPSVFYSHSEEHFGTTPLYFSVNISGQIKLNLNVILIANQSCLLSKLIPLHLNVDINNFTISDYTCLRKMFDQLQNTNMEK